MKKILRLSSYSLVLAATAHAQSDFERGRETILKQAGCYVIDYSFAETGSLRDGYNRDGRIYDTNADKTTYELIVPIEKSPTEIRLQHVLFMRNLQSGEVGGLMKHQAEDWAFQAPHSFEFVAPGTWEARTGTPANSWLRKITNLDDGLRYQCAAPWNFANFNPEWNCENFAPIPGRETRDMGRRDYNTLHRDTRLIVYQDSWVERQNNVKTIWTAGERAPLARELGRTWLVKQPMEACQEASAYAQQKMPYWKVLMEVWEEYLGVAQNFKEVPAVDGVPRFAAMFDVEEEFGDRVASEPTVIPQAKARMREIIERYRLPAQQ